MVGRMPEGTTVACTPLSFSQFSSESHPIFNTSIPLPTTNISTISAPQQHGQWWGSFSLFLQAITVQQAENCWGWRTNIGILIFPPHEILENGWRNATHVELRCPTSALLPPPLLVLIHAPLPAPRHRFPSQLSTSVQCCYSQCPSYPVPPILLVIHTAPNAFHLYHIQALHLYRWAFTSSLSP